MQFYEASSSITQPKLSVVLSWDTDNTDLDLHVISPDGQHCWYGDRVANNGGALLVYLNYYGSGPRDDLTVATVSIVVHQNTPDERIETAVVPMRAPGELTLVRSFVVP